MRKCQCCNSEILKDEGVTIITDDIEGGTFMHQSCFDDVWGSFLNRQRVTNLLTYCGHVINKEAVKQQSDKLFKLQNEIDEFLNEGI